MKTILTLGEAFKRRHNWLLCAAKNTDVALCGGCAAAIVKEDTNYVPKDIDFVAKQSDALKMIGMINTFMLARNSHWRMYANAHNGFVPSNAIGHFRITSFFWLPVCLFVLPDEAFRAYRIKGGYMLQLFEDIKRAADELTEIDAKPRIASNYTEPLAPAETLDETLDRLDDIPDDVPPELGGMAIEHLDSQPPERIGSGSPKA